MNELSPPLTIEERIRCAMSDDEQRHIIYYRRIEGASSAALRIAEKDKKVVVLSGHHCKRECEERGIKYLNYNSPTQKIWNMRASIIIADVVPASMMREWSRELIRLGNKVIELRGVRTDEIN